MSMLEALAQWAIFLISLPCYLVGALFNGLVGWRTWVRGEVEGSSPAPFLFGLIGIVVVLSAPFGALPDRLAYLWLPLLLDYGSGPYLLMILYDLLIRRGRG